MRKYLVQLLCLTCLLFLSDLVALANTKDQITSLPGLGKVQGVQMAGYLSTNPNQNPYRENSNFFYWFVGSERNVEQDPLIIWLNGGPGSSSLYGFFLENGPYMINNDGAPVPRAFPWSKKANYLIIEQASSVGFSYAAEGVHLANEAAAVDLFLKALQAFYKKYPELKKNPLFIAGESYAGKFIPLLATYILKKARSIPLQGILIGDGWVNPLIQLSSDAEFAYSHGLIDQTTRTLLEEKYQLCAEAIRKETPSSREANQICDTLLDLIQEKSGVSPTNIRTLAEESSAPICRYLNRKDVREALHVDPRVQDFSFFSERVSKDLEIGLLDSAAPLYASLIAQGVRVLIYNGLDDGRDCNFIGTDLWLAALEWPGKEHLKDAPTSIWKSKTGDIAGYVRAADGLTQVKIRGAGHIAPMDQPQNVQDMVYYFLFQEKFPSR